MKCFVVFIITWSLVASYPLDNQAQDEDRDEGTDLETRSSFIPEIDILDIPDTSISDVPQPHISSIYRRKRKGRKGKGRKGKGRKGKGRKGKGRKGKGKGRGSTFKFGNSFGNVGQQGINTGHVALGHQFNSKRQMSFGATSGNVGQQGTNSGNVGVGNQVNGRK